MSGNIATLRKIYQLRLLLNRLKQTFFKLKFVINNRKLVRFKDTFFICSKKSEYHHIMVPYYSYLIHHNFFCGFPCFDVKTCILCCEVELFTIGFGGSVCFQQQVLGGHCTLFDLIVFKLGPLKKRSSPYVPFSTLISRKIKLISTCW